jgi:hypothetical protein
MAIINTFYYNKTGSTGPVGNIYVDQGLPEDIPDEVIEKMLNAAADVIEPEIKRNAETMLNERGYSTGATARSITRRMRSRYLEIYFQGTRQDGKKAAEIAFINEYGLGKTGGDQDTFYDQKMGGRFFIKKAIDTKADEALDAAEKVFREWQKNSKGE